LDAAQCGAAIESEGVAMSSPEKTKTARVLVVGQTPPPYHGQGIMLERLVKAKMNSVTKHHVRMAFSSDMDQVGRFRVGKLLHLMSVVAQIVYHRFAQRLEILYFPPAGPNRIPMWRDFVILVCTRWLFKKTVFHLQASGISELYGRIGWLERWFFRRAYFRPDLVIRLSEFALEDGKALEAVEELIIPNCADDELEKFGSVMQARAARDATEPVRLLYLGTVCRSKGIFVLLDACRQLVVDRVNFHLDVVGSFQPASLAAEIHAAIAEGSLQDHVTLCGQLTGSEKFAKFAGADLFCFPSHYESEAFPCVLVEAMSFELPTVSTRWRGIPSIVEDGETGILVSPQNSSELAVALQRLCGDPMLRQRLGTAGRVKFEREFTTERHVELMESALSSVAEPGPKLTPMATRSAAAKGQEMMSGS
jgi:glycosyltransferase involved in cell wall biosynthesis